MFGARWSSEKGFRFGARGLCASDVTEAVAEPQSARVLCSFSDRSAFAPAPL